MLRLFQAAKKEFMYKFKVQARYREGEMMIKEFLISLLHYFADLLLICQQPCLSALIQKAKSIP